MEEDKEIIDALEICFQELTDKGFQVNIEQLDLINDTKLYSVNIYKNNRKSFYINDVIEYLLFTEAYMKDEFNLAIEKFGIDKYYYINIKCKPISNIIHTVRIILKNN